MYPIYTPIIIPSGSSTAATTAATEMTGSEAIMMGILTLILVGMIGSLILVMLADTFDWKHSEVFWKIATVFAVTLLAILFVGLGADALMYFGAI